MHENDNSLNEKIKSMLEMSSGVNANSFWVKNSNDVRNPLAFADKNSLSNLPTDVQLNKEAIILEHGDKSPLEVFEMFFDGLFELIVQESINYARHRNDTTFQVTIAEMRQFFGILLLSGYHNVPQVDLMWDTNFDCGIECVRDCMSRNRF